MSFLNKRGPSPPAADSMARHIFKSAPELAASKAVVLTDVNSPGKTACPVKNRLYL